MNVFEQLAECQIAAPVKARQRAAEKRAAAKRDKALAERDDMFQLWKHWHRERLDALLAGPHGPAARELIAFLRTMTLTDGAALVARARDWQHADAGSRFEILSLIDGAITAVREERNLVPFDDPLHGDQPSVFLVVREMLR
jgi:hypothetical protein